MTILVCRTCHACHVYPSRDQSGAVNARGCCWYDNPHLSDDRLTPGAFWVLG